MPSSRQARDAQGDLAAVRDRDAGERGLTSLPGRSRRGAGPRGPRPRRAAGDRLRRAFRCAAGSPARGREQALGARPPAAPHAGARRAASTAASRARRRRAPRARCGPRARGVEELPVRKSARACERPICASAKGADRRRDHPQPHLAEPEPPPRGERDVAAGDPSLRRGRRLHARDHRHRAGADGREHGGPALRVGHVLVVAERPGGAHPVDVAPAEKTTCRARRGRRDAADAVVGRGPRPWRRAARRSASASKALLRRGPVEPDPRRALPCRSRETALTSGTRRSPARGSGRAWPRRGRGRGRVRVSSGSRMPSSQRRAVEWKGRAFRSYCSTGRPREPVPRRLGRMASPRARVVEADGQDRRGRRAPPITPMRAFGHMNRIAGPKARPPMP